nr:hypothetical protein [Rhodococcus sp. (in: high G+C Gram-positive bacteria)]
MGEPSATDSSGAESRQTIARQYIDALASHDARAVKFAPGARRVENGITTGRSGPGLARGLESAFYYRTILAVRDIETTESGDTVEARFLIDAGVLGKRMVTVAVQETFLVPDGTIHLVRAKLRLRFGRTPR